MQISASSFFQGLTQDDVARVLSQPEYRRYPAGATVLVEGAVSREMYVIQTGTADVLIHDRHGAEHRVSRLGAGATVGEMALFTGQPASATVQAVGDLEVLVLSEPNFHRIAAAYPRIYQNLGAILSERLAHSNRRSLQNSIGSLTTLYALDAPPLLGYALACSVAWHTRGTVLLLVLGAEPHPDLLAIAEASSGPSLPSGGGNGSRPMPAYTARHGAAAIQFEKPEGAFHAEHLPLTLEDLCRRYDHILVQQAAGDAVPPASGHWLCLADPHTTASARLLSQHGRILVGWDDGADRFRPDADRVLRVPPLQRVDEAALREGSLPPRSAAGRVLGWVARDMCGLKVGLALGGGVAKGYAHIGVFKALERHGVPIDYLAGTSIGAAVGALYGMGKSHDEAARTVDELGALAFRFSVPLVSLLSNARLAAGIRRLVAKTRIEDLVMPMGIVATDLTSGREVVFTRGPLWSAVVASMAIPGIYPPQRVGPYILVDGGVVNPVPSSVPMGMGAGTVFAVKLGVPPTEGAPVRVAPARGRSPLLVEALTRSLDLMQTKMSETTAVAGASATTILIQPAFKEGEIIGLRKFNQGRKYIDLGDAAVEAVLPSMAASLPWLRKA